MIVVDSSALMAVVLNEAAGARCLATMDEHDPVCMSAGTLAEALIVGGRRGVGSEAAVLIDQLVDEIVSVDDVMARQAADAYARWGKRNHPARLNLGDCFAYALAKSRDLPLLYIGDDFGRTDVRSALA